MPWWTSRRRKYEQQVLARLTEIEETLAGIAAALRNLNQGLVTVNQQIDDIIKTLNDNTNAVAAKVDKLTAELANAVTPDQLASLQAVADHLRALGADPSNPVPAPAPAATVAPAPAADTASGTSTT